MKSYAVLAASACALIAMPTVATPVAPSSYDMLNGNTGSYEYWDETYTGAGCVTCNNAALTGGLGDLTDGIIATDNWYVVEAPAGNGPYVGWTLDPTITFHFAPGTAIDSINIYYDDSNGAGGVSTPGSFVINGVNYAVTDAPGSAPNVFTVSGLGFVGDTFTLTANRNNSWVFLSEVSFDSGTGSVPEPATWAMMLAGLGAVGVGLRRRSRTASIA